jgi:hypothetical protein
MKRLIMVGLLAVAVSSYSYVYACDHSHRTVMTTASTSDTKIIRTVVVDATTGCRLDRSGCKADKSRVMTFEFEVPAKDATHFVNRVERERAALESPSPIRTAMTLGRAMVTTVGAVFSSIMDTLSQLTASLV